MRINAVFVGMALAAVGAAQAQSNPAMRPSRDISAMAGAWNGSHIEQRTNCRSSQNGGFHGTYADFGVYVDPVAHFMSITETGVTGLSCTWSGQYHDESGVTVVTGSLSCSDGRTGSFESHSFYTTTTLMTMRLSVQLTGSETCSIDAILTGAHF